jgi:1,4-alpha-glucan branching enzyme
VRHPEHEDFLEEDWLFEAITETYIPLLWIMEDLVEDEMDFRLTISLTPPLISMLNDDLLRRRYARHRFFESRFLACKKRRQKKDLRAHNARLPKAFTPPPIAGFLREGASGIL